MSDAPAERDLVAMLLAIARAADTLCDNSCEEDGLVRVEKTDLEALGAALNALDSLRDPVRDVCFAGPAKAELLLGCWDARGWLPIESAPRDGTPIQVVIPGHGADNIVAWLDGLESDEGTDCGGWFFASEQEPPDCWTDGICWAVNEDGEPSVQPTHWRPLRAQP